MSHVYRGTEMTDPEATSANATIERTHDKATAGTATRCARSLIHHPAKPRIKNATNGRRGIKAYMIIPGLRAACCVLR